MQENIRGIFLMDKVDKVMSFTLMIEDLSDLRARATTPREWESYHDKVIETYDELKTYLYEILRIVN